ncbi:M56 family metallopeptidase [Dyadobacter sp. 676]|uniref:M56 family metallopeptidase n=1 Tax=Dyadobacter sp. 676 TaxID=3088362 RepID=A0AAU8FJJ8_9BACT
MSAFPDYLLKLSVSFAVIAIFYHLVLRRLTFFDWNRHYLCWYSVQCFVFPLININTFLTPSAAPSPAHAFVQSVPAIASVAPAGPAPAWPVVPAEPVMPESADWVFRIWLAGAVVMLFRLLVNLRSYLRIRAQSRLFSDDGVKIYHFDLEMSPFSFWNAIFYNPRLHHPDELQDMILHEYVHVQQRHSIDVIWSEVICIVNWFNPFAWLIRSAIRQNLEYIADQKVLENHGDPKAYQYLLLRTAVGKEFPLINQFGCHSLKQRIVMMNRRASPRMLLSCFLFVFPLLAVLLAAFRADQPGESPRRNSVRIWSGGFEESKRKPKDLLHLSGLILDAETQKPIAGYVMNLYHDDRFIKTVTTDMDGFYFEEVPAKPEKNVTRDYTLRGVSDDFITGKSYQEGMPFGDGFTIFFLRKPELNSLLFTSYGVSPNPFYDSYDPRNTAKELKSYLLESVPPFAREMQLRVEYFRLKRWPKGVITVYKGAYFDRNRRLMGYRNKTKLFLNGKPADYTQINAAFKDYPYLLTEKQEKRTYNHHMSASEISYFTFPVYRDAPPVALVKGNVEIKDVRSFDPSRLNTEPYMLDGFRQVYGASSNLMPAKQEIKQVMLLKGSLAKYYDPALDRIWWIETRPVNEVFERPDFALK